MLSQEHLQPHYFMDRPSYAKKEYLLFLDELMENGLMTSFKASQLMMHRFPVLSLEQINTILSYWLYSYCDRREHANPDGESKSKQ